MSLPENPLNFFQSHGILHTGIITWFVPCVTFGQNAEAAGTASSCVMGALLFLLPVVGVVCWIKTRGAIREQHGIEVRTF